MASVVDEIQKHFSLSKSRKHMMFFMNLVQPYAELMRLHRPTGVLNIFFPYFYGFFYGLRTSPSFRDNINNVAFRIFLLLFSAFTLRSWGCVWNDIVDAEIDRLVERTRSRPMARGALSYTSAYLFNAGLSALWLVTLKPLLPDPRTYGLYVLPLTILVILYPYVKRVTNFTQVHLGFTLGWGALMGGAMTGVDILSTALGAGFLAPGRNNGSSAEGPQRSLEQIYGLLGLYAAYIIWTVIHDVIYAFQDVKDDVKAGVKSLAVLLGDEAKPVLLALAVLQVSILAMVSTTWTPPAMDKRNLWTGEFLSVGHVVDDLISNVAYTWIAVCGNAVVLMTMIAKVDLDDPRSCAWWFRMGSILIDLSIGLGLAVQTWLSVLHD